MKEAEADVKKSIFGSCWKQMYLTLIYIKRLFITEADGLLRSLIIATGKFHYCQVYFTRCFKSLQA